MYPGLLLGAGLSAEHLADALDQLVFKGASPGIGQALLDLASADHVYQIDGWPAGFPHHLSFRGFFSNSNQLKQFFDGHVPVQDAERTHERFFAARENMAAVCPGNREGEIARQEMLVAADMALLGCVRAIRYLKGLDTTADYESVIKEYQAVWLLRARPGGLSESLALLSRVSR
jgi:hypothetical protein